MNVPVLLDFNKSQLQVIRQMCAKDCTATEFDLFLEMCKARGLNPLLKHIYAMVLNKDSKDPKKPRQLTIVVSVEGQRHIANRKGDYRPDDKVPSFEADPDLRDPVTNPAGLISATVGCYAYRHGEWHYAPHIAYWEEYAPLIEEWAEDPATGNRARTGRLILDPKKPNWRKMPRVMLPKCAEFGALRKAFPDDFGGLYGEEEMDRAHSLDMSASQILEEAAREERQQLVGGPGVMIDWMSGGPLQKVPIGQLHDRAVEFVRGLAGSPEAIRAFEERNRHAMNDLWAHSKGDGLDLKEEIAKAKAVIVEEEPVQEPKEAPRPAKKTKGALPRLKLKDPAHGDKTLSSLRQPSQSQAKKPKTP